jgi:alkane 1-monooxygenase
MNHPFKYLLAWTIPASFLVSLTIEGAGRYFTVFYAFGILPLLELFLKPDTKNPSDQEESDSGRSKTLDWILWATIPIQWACLSGFLFRIHSTVLSGFEFSGLVFSMGICCGVLGINAAHELGHRKSGFERVLSRLLLMTSLYWQFYVEHNRGHHKHVATPEDSESAHRGESLPRFWVRSLLLAFRNAWRIDPVEMAWGTGIQLFLVLSIHLYFGPEATLAFLASAMIGALLLQSVNYIEHYGLVRKRLDNGGYEKVLPRHSWNSSHPLSRFVLFELSRHSDHHANATRKYPLLRHFEDAPQMPTGYPGMILLALVPPLWFGYMDRKLEEVDQNPRMST